MIQRHCRQQYHARVTKCGRCARQTSIIMPHPENPPPRNRSTPPGENRKSQHQKQFVRMRACETVRTSPSKSVVGVLQADERHYAPPQKPSTQKPHPKPPPKHPRSQLAQNAVVGKKKQPQARFFLAVEALCARGYIMSEGIARSWHQITPKCIQTLTLQNTRARGLLQLWLRLRL